MSDKPMSLYDVLGVARDAPYSTIKKSFLRKSRELHPDKWSHADPSVQQQKTKEFQALTAAHEELKDPERRKDYDRWGITAQERADEGWAVPEAVQKKIRWTITREQWESGGPIDIDDQLSGVRETGLRFSPGAKTARGEQSGAEIRFVVEAGRLDLKRPVRLDLKKGLSQAGGSGASLPDTLTVSEQVRRYRELEQAELNLSLIKDFETQHKLKYPRQLLENQISAAMESTGGSCFANGDSGMAAQLQRLDITPEECIRGFKRRVDAPGGGAISVDQPDGARDGDLAMFERGPGAGASQWSRVEYETASEIQQHLRDTGQQESDLQLFIVEFRVQPLSAGSDGYRELGLDRLDASVREAIATAQALAMEYAAKRNAEVRVANNKATQCAEELANCRKTVVALQRENAQLRKDIEVSAQHAKDPYARILRVQQPKDDSRHCCRSHKQGKWKTHSRIFSAAERRLYCADNGSEHIVDTEQNRRKLLQENVSQGDAYTSGSSQTAAQKYSREHNRAEKDMDMDQLSHSEDAEESSCEGTEESSWSLNLVTPLSEVWSAFWKHPSCSSDARPLPIDEHARRSPSQEPKQCDGVPLASTTYANAMKRSHAKASSKEQATALQTDGNYHEAALSFQKVLDQLPNAPGSAGERSDLHSHRAACFECLEQYTEVVEECTAALEYQGSTCEFIIEQLCRRSRAYERREKHRLAVNDMQGAHDLDPTSIHVQKELNRLKKKIASLKLGESRAHVAGGQSQQSDRDLTSARASRSQRVPQHVAAAPSPSPTDPRVVKIDMFGSGSDSD